MAVYEKNMLSGPLSKLFCEYKEGKIHILYGPGASGKTTCCYLAAIEAAKKGFKTLYLDTENGFNSERCTQLCNGNSSSFLDSVLLLRTHSYSKQKSNIENLMALAKNEKVKLIIIDSIGNHYRTELKGDVYLTNRSMDEQLQIISKLKDHGKIIILTNQVYQNIETNEVTMVGGNMIREKGDFLIELQKDDYNGRVAVIRKDFDGGNSNMKKPFEITEKGIE
ncbi:MAG: AAA family ATPase [archaeon]